MPFDRKKLIFLRNREKITQHKLSWETFIPTPVIFRLESNKGGKGSKPTFETVEKLADFFKVNMETFCCKTKEI